ncbi:MAG: hybrid sensor histidine kinase/response regulator, partial [Novosphingobium sp.]
MAARARAPRGSEGLVLALALALSLVIVWLATDALLTVAAFGAGLLALGAVIWTLTRTKAAALEAETALPDWSVTVAAIDRSDAAMAITDRAGRLVCANGLYEQWFTAAHAPPRLPVDNASLERLAKAARAGWR